MEVTVIEIKHYQLKTSEIISKSLDTWKIQLAVANIPISSIDHDEERAMHSKSDDMKS